MNADEARVPDLEGDWQSIEIFLFSNGQQYSPPRKYNLRADELNLWDETLNLLAHSHYGLQSPPINLYTTDGHLVEGPLELKDGLAYVAVTSPDPFIDAGYHKYLIRASRSWEKRQARKKIPECVLEEICCLCPEKDDCCDPQTCCLCPEKEDEDYLESLSATGYPELGPAGRHFMSSALSEPAVADDYRPRSGKISSTAAEHAVRPGEYGAKQGEFGYLPVESVAKPAGYGARLVEYGASANEHALRLSENGSRLGEFTTRPDEYGAKLNENAMKPGAYEAYPGEHAARLSKNGVRPSKARPVENKTRSSFNGVKTNEYGAKPTEHETKLVNGANPSEYETRPTVNGAEPSEYKARLGENEAKPSEYKSRPGQNGTRPSVNNNNSGGYVAKPTINGAKPDEYGARPSEYETKQSVNGARHSVNEARSKNVPKPSEYKARPSENRAKLIEYKARPGEYEAKPGEYEAKPGEYESRPTVNGAMPCEHKARPGENETRRSVNGAKPSEYGARMGEYESRPRENDPKPGEYETRSSVNGAKPGEYRARSGEFTNLSVDQRTRPDEYGPRPGKGGAWSDDDGVRPTVHEARPGNDGPWSNEIDSEKESYEIALRENKRSLDDNVDRPDKDTVDKDAREDSKFCKQSSTLSPIDECELEKKGEHRVTESDQRDKQIDPKGRASGNGGKVGRRVNDGEQNGRENDTLNRMSEPKAIQNENARRPSELRPPGIENKRRPSQQKGGIEQTRRLSGQAGEQKGRETNPAGRAGLNTARLSEQRNKKSDNLARLGGRESRVGDHEARAGDLGLRSSDHDAGLVNPGSRVAEPGARAAVSGSRASPRDRMSSIARTSNLGQPKLGSPGTRVDETVAKLEESGIKNKVGYPGTRQSSVAGTGAAGASHISEAQQHTRKSSLSAGTASTEKKRLSIGQNSSLLRKPTPISSVLHKSEDKQPIKTNKEILPKRMTSKANAVPVPASNDAGKSKTMPKDPYKHITPPALDTPPVSLTNLVNLATNKAPLENVIDEKEINEKENEIRSMRLDSVKIIVDVSNNSPKATQTELIYDEKSKVSGITVNEGVQTNTEVIEHHRQEVSTSSTAKVNSYTCTCALCCKRDHRLATVDPDENIISIQNKGDVINLKLNIEVRNIVRSVYSCQKNCLRSRSLTNIMSSEKESQISIEDGMFARRKRSLQSVVNHTCFREYGFESSPQLMVVQCAGCGRLNYPPRCDLPPCCDNNKKYFVLLSNSLNEDVVEDMDDCCNFNPPCRPCCLRQSQEKKSSSGIPLKQALSEMTLDTITTVTVSGVPLQRQEMEKKTDTTCQTEEPQGECMMTKRKVSISADTGTKCDNQKESSSSILVMTQVKQSKQLCPQKCEHEDSQVCPEFCPPETSCQKVQSVCSQVSTQTCPEVQTQGCMPVSPPSSTCCPKPIPCIQVRTQECMPLSPPSSTCCPKPIPSIQVQTQGCMPVSPPSSTCCPKPIPCIQVKTQECIPVSPTCSTSCPKPIPCIQIQTQVCPQAFNAQTQTQWNCVILLARLHPDGRYSFHLPPLKLFKSYPF